MQKNKFIHKDIKAVCTSAVKKLVAFGVVTAIGVGCTVGHNVSFVGLAQQPSEKKPEKEGKHSDDGTFDFEKELDELSAKMEACTRDIDRNNPRLAEVFAFSDKIDDKLRQLDIEREKAKERQDKEFRELQEIEKQQQEIHRQVQENQKRSEQLHDDLDELLEIETDFFNGPQPEAEEKDKIVLEEQPKNEISNTDKQTEKEPTTQRKNKIAQKSTPPKKLALDWRRDDDFSKALRGRLSNLEAKIEARTRNIGRSDPRVAEDAALIDKANEKCHQIEIERAKAPYLQARKYFITAARRLGKYYNDNVSSSVSIFSWFSKQDRNIDIDRLLELESHHVKELTNTEDIDSWIAYMQEEVWRLKGVCEQILGMLANLNPKKTSSAGLTHGQERLVFDWVVYDLYNDFERIKFLPKEGKNGVWLEFSGRNFRTKAEDRLCELSPQEVWLFIRQQAVGIRTWFYINVPHIWEKLIVPEIYTPEQHKDDYADFLGWCAAYEDAEIDLLKTNIRVQENQRAIEELTENLGKLLDIEIRFYEQLDADSDENSREEQQPQPQQMPQRPENKITNADEQMEKEEIVRDEHPRQQQPKPKQRSQRPKNNTDRQIEKDFPTQEKTAEERLQQLSAQVKDTENRFLTALGRLGPKKLKLKNLPAFELHNNDVYAAYSGWLRNIQENINSLPELWDRDPEKKSEVERTLQESIDLLAELEGYSAERRRIEQENNRQRTFDNWLEALNNYNRRNRCPIAIIDKETGSMYFKDIFSTKEDERLRGYTETIDDVDKNSKEIIDKCEAKKKRSAEQDKILEELQKEIDEENKLLVQGQIELNKQMKESDEALGELLAFYKAHNQEYKEKLEDESNEPLVINHQPINNIRETNKAYEETLEAESNEPFINQQPGNDTDAQLEQSLDGRQTELNQMLETLRRLGVGQQYISSYFVEAQKSKEAFDQFKEFFQRLMSFYTKGD